MAIDEKALENMRACNFHIICVLVMQSEALGVCRYRVYTSDGGFTDYLGYDNLPDLCRKWLSERNSFEYVIPSCMFVSGCKVV